MMCEMIKHTRQFTYIHGGVVGSHDVLGQRLGKFYDILMVSRLVNLSLWSVQLIFYSDELSLYFTLFV